MTELSEKWIERFLKLATEVATWSTDSTKVGSVIVGKDKNIISTGYNGFCRGVRETETRKLPEYKYYFTEHAERNAIYLAKSSVDEAILFSTHVPCADCARAIIQSGIKNVYYCNELENFKWNQSVTIAKMMFSEADVALKYVNITESSSVGEETSKTEISCTDISTIDQEALKKALRSYKDAPKVQIHWQENGPLEPDLRSKITRLIGTILNTPKRLLK
jgi:dCMP deaminase